VRKDCRWSLGPEVRGRRTLQELSEVCPVWDFVTDAHSDEELAFELSWNCAMWSAIVGREGAVLPTDPRWG
jgi:hypothetical protein